MAYLRLLVISLISICIAKNVTRCHLTRYFIFKEQCTVNIFRFLSTFWLFICCSKSVCFTILIIPKIKVHFNKLHYILYIIFDKLHNLSHQLIYRFRICDMWIISCFFQCFDDLIFMFCTKCFHCDRKFHSTVSVDTYKLVMFKLHNITLSLCDHF